ncbi:glycosyltransferase [mine drainage metagenome]|uniref:Glycosyltransferase n=1 Tax=mine drainage metagenome TaxID=410659 RepID=T1CA26_9ZZZZ
MVAPLRVGAGVKGKVNQALAQGLPVVGTPIAAEGIPLEHGHSALLADDAIGFAREVVRLYQDPVLWETLRRAGLEITETHYSSAAARRALGGLFRDLGLRADRMDPVGAKAG